MSTRVVTDRRELVFKRINPFSEAKRKLFGSGFEQRLKLRSETAETVKKASKIGQPFFRGAASRGIPRSRGAVRGLHAKTTAKCKQGRTGSVREKDSEADQSPRFQNPTSFNPKQI